MYLLYSFLFRAYKTDEDPTYDIIVDSFEIGETNYEIKVNIIHWCYVIMYNKMLHLSNLQLKRYVSLCFL